MRLFPSPKNCIMRGPGSGFSKLGQTYYRESPTSTVSTSMNSTTTNFGTRAIGIKFVPVEVIISKFVIVEFSLCM